MKSFTVLFVIAFNQAIALPTIQRRGTNDYAVSTAKPSIVSESSISGSAAGINSAKYQSPPYVPPQKNQFSSPQQLNYLVQPAYRLTAQPTPPVASYVPQQVQQGQQHPQYIPQNVVYNQQPLARVPIIPQKISYSPVESQVPTSAPYSLAGDVSSFKYSSPLVSYSNLGVIQQATGKTSVPTHQEAAIRSHYSQQLPQTSSLPRPSLQPATYNPPQQVIYRPRLQLPQLTYNPAAQQPAPSPSPKLIYSQIPQTISSGQRTQPIYPGSTQKLVSSAPQQVLYTVPQQAVYTPVQPANYAAQPAQPSHSIPQPVYVVAPQYSSNGAFRQHD